MSSKKHLCVVLHEGPGGRRFADELTRRFQQAFGHNVPIITDIYSFTEDKYDSLVNHLEATKYCVVAINAEFLADSWHQYCSSQVKHYSMKRELILIPVGIDNFSDFSGVWSIYSPMVFGQDLQREESKFGRLLDAINYVPARDRNVHDHSTGKDSEPADSTPPSVPQSPLPTDTASATEPSTPTEPPTPTLVPPTQQAPLTIAPPTQQAPPPASIMEPSDPPLVIEQDTLPASFSQFRDDQKLDLFKQLAPL